jgi:hypothetical protein
LNSSGPNMAINDFVIFILSHGRPDNVLTVKSLKKFGYTGELFIIIDNEDQEAEKYRKNYGDKVIVFDKAKVAETFDEGDNFKDRRAVIYARNACFDIAREMGKTYFMELDDDYIDFRYKINSKGEPIHRKPIKNLDVIIGAMLDFFKAINAKSIAMAQGGDFIGGKQNGISSSINQRRKAMNTFICSIDRPFKFVGRVNEDVNTYVWFQSLGNLFLTFPLVAIQQNQTQKNKGGMTELYLDSGTYIKSFYTVMFSPSCVKVKMMGIKNPRLHHSVDWDCAVPVIIQERFKK